MKKIKKIISDCTLEQLEECINKGVSMEICQDGWTVKYSIEIGGKEVRYKSPSGVEMAFDMIKNSVRDKRIDFILESKVTK